MQFMRLNAPGKSDPPGCCGANRGIPAGSARPAFDQAGHCDYICLFLLFFKITLAAGLEQQHPGGNGNIEACHLPSHGNRDQVVT